MNQSINQLIWLIQSMINQSTNQPINQWMNQSIIQSINQWLTINQLIKFDWSNHQSDDSDWLNQPIIGWFNLVESFNQSINVNQSIQSMINQFNSIKFNWLIIWINCQSINVNQSINQWYQSRLTINQFNNQSMIDSMIDYNQPINDCEEIDWSIDSIDWFT